MSTSKKDWIYFAKLCAEEFKIIRNQAEKESPSKDEAFYINKYLTSRSDWSRKINNYLSFQVQNNATKSRTNIAAKLAVCPSEPEEKLISSIILAREGYFKCSLAALSQITKQKKLTRDERLDACMAVLENITANKPIFRESPSSSDLKDEWIYASKLNSRIIKILGITLDLYQSEEELDELSLLIEEVINAREEKAPMKHQLTEKKALEVAGKRNLLIQELSQTHERPIIRSIHHLACTGGTLISKCLACMNDIALVGEINPLNRTGSRFELTNPILLLQNNYRLLTREEIMTAFKLNIRTIYQICQGDDTDLILRDHSHTDFFTGNEISKFSPIVDGLADDFELISAVTVRHPLDSYLSLISNGWEKEFQPNDLNEYSKRYLAFLEKYQSLEIIRYEDFCENPKGEMRDLCRILKICYSDNFTEEFGSHQLSGDSGRKGTQRIERRTRRAIPEEIQLQIESSEYYSTLIDRLNY